MSLPWKHQKTPFSILIALIFLLAKLFHVSLVLRMEYLSCGGGDISILPFAVGWMRPGGNCDERRLSLWTFD